MGMNTHFSVATHILAFLHLQPGKAISSEALATSVNTNAGFVRRVLSELHKAGITKSVLGTNGGTTLAKRGEEITLRDVYLATGSAGQVFTPHAEPNEECPVGKNILGALLPRFEEADLALQASLAQNTIEDVAEDIRRSVRRERAEKSAGSPLASGQP